MILVSAASVKLMDLLFRFSCLVYLPNIDKSRQPHDSHCPRQWDVASKCGLITVTIQVQVVKLWLVTLWLTRSLWLDLS